MRAAPTAPRTPPSPGSRPIRARRTRARIGRWPRTVRSRRAFLPRRTRPPAFRAGGADLELRDRSPPALRGWDRRRQPRRPVPAPACGVPDPGTRSVATGRRRSNGLPTGQQRSRSIDSSSARLSPQAATIAVQLASWSSAASCPAGPGRRRAPGGALRCLLPGRPPSIHVDRWALTRRTPLHDQLLPRGARSERPRGHVRRSVGSTHSPGTEDREQALADSP